jgi:group I intron endonuclease
MVCGVYRVINLSNGEFYVGSSKDVDKRWRSHLSEQRNQVDGKKVSCPLLYEAIRRDGVENFKLEMIEECEPDRELLFEREQHYLDVLQPPYNKAPTAKGVPPNIGNKEFRHTDESKRRQSEIHKELRAQKIAERGYYISPEGLESARQKREAMLTPERRAQFAEETKEALELAHKAYMDKADQFTYQFYPIIAELQKTGLNFIEIAKELNVRGYKTFRGLDWFDGTVAKLVKRYKKLESMLPQNHRYQAEHARKKNADDFALKFFPIIDELKKRGMNMTEIAAQLNADGHVSRRNAPWTYQNVREVLKRIEQLPIEAEEMTPERTPEVRRLDREVYGHRQTEAKPAEPERRIIGWSAIATRR